MATTPHVGPSEAVQDYAKAIYALALASNGRVATNALAARLGVSAPSVSAMLKKLDERGLATHVAYKGVALTPDGERLALEVTRHHRLLETFLAEQLDVPWDRVHAEADALEHVLSEYLEERIAAKLGHPTHDPHGDPIPNDRLQLDERRTTPLADLEPGDRGRLARVSDADPAMLRYLDAHGIALGAQCEVLERQPFDGPLTVRIGGELHAFGEQLARAVRLEVLL